MLRLTEIKLPLDHVAEKIPAAICARLGLKADELISFTIFRRGVDARKKAAIHFIYTLDIETTRDAEVLDQFSTDPHVVETPDTRYQFVIHDGLLPTGTPRPVVVGTGPCGLFAALVLAQMGFRPMILERGKAVRERTKDTWGFGASAFSIRNPMCSSAKAVPARFPMASSTARSRTRTLRPQGT